MELTTRNATLADLAVMLKDQHSRKVDVVAPSTALRMEDGILRVEGCDVHIGIDGVTTVDGRYLPTAIFDEGISAKLGIPLAYVRRMRETRVDLYDQNVNGWLHGPKGGEADARSFLVRAFTSGDPVGVARAMLSDSYKVIDNFDVLSAALEGVRDSNLGVQVDGCDLSERRMTVRLVAPEITALCETLVENYRSPFTGQMGKDNPVVEAGLVISNSETGGGAFTITPRLKLLVCSNGLTITKDAMRAVHLGGKLDEGVINWSADTQMKAMELVSAKTVDAVKTFLDVDYVVKTVRALEEKAGKKLDKPVEQVQMVAKKLAYSEETTNLLLDHFIRGGDTTAGGLLHAVTSAAQVVNDPDEAQSLEESAFRAMELVTTL